MSGQDRICPTCGSVCILTTTPDLKIVSYACQTCQKLIPPDHAPRTYYVPANGEIWIFSLSGFNLELTRQRIDELFGKTAGEYITSILKVECTVVNTRQLERLDPNDPES